MPDLLTDTDLGIGMPAAPAAPAMLSDADVGLGAQPSMGTDIAKSAGIGLAKGAIGVGGMGGDLWSMVSGGLEKAGVPENYRDMMRKSLMAIIPGAGLALQGPTSAELQKDVEAQTGQFYQPQTTAGKFAQTVGEFVPGMVVPGGGGLVRRGLTAAGAGLGSEAAGQALEGSPTEPYARVAGAVAGGMAPGALGRAITPLPASQARREAVNILRGEGVTGLTAGDVTGRKGLQYYEQMRGGQTYGGLKERQAEQLTQAVTRRAGVTPDNLQPYGLQDTTRFGPEVVDATFTRLGNNYDTLAARNPLPLNNQLLTEMGRIERTYFDETTPSTRISLISNIIRDIGDMMVQGQPTISGELYQNLRSQLEKAGRGFLYSDPKAADAAFGLKGVLDDALARGMQDPADRALLRQTNREYRYLKLATRAVNNEGLITPKSLASVQQRTEADRQAFKRGKGDLNQLTRAAEMAMQTLPNSGTAQRLNALAPGGIGATIGSALGAVLGTAVGSPIIGGMAGAMTGAALPQLGGRAVLSNPLRSYLGNQLLPAGPAIAPNLATQGLLGAQQGGLLNLPSPLDVWPNRPPFDPSY